MERKYYLDNLKTIMILLLIPIHTFMIWNNFGQKFYIWHSENRFLSTIIVFINPWIMSLLFLIAGMCAKYSLEKRNTKEFVKERINKLLIPFIAGVIVLVPLQTLYARKFFYAYKGGILENYKYFFTHITNLTGYDGCFTPAHLWFLLYLTLISLIALIIIKYIPTPSKIEKISIPKIIMLSLLIWVTYYIGNFNSYSFGKYFTLYILGYYIFSNEKVINKIITNKKIIISLFLISEIILTTLYYKSSYYGDLLVNIVGWLGVLTLLIIGKLFLNKETKITKYFKNASFPIYILHQTILVILAYYTLLIITNKTLQIITIMIGTYIITLLAYKIIKRIPYIKKLFGIKEANTNE